MSKLIVAGGAALRGESRVSGSKNAVLPILAAAVMARRPVRISRCPLLSDVRNMAEIISELGCAVKREDDALVIDAADADCCELPERLSKELRSSIFLMGPVLARFGRAVAAYPGGCEIGNRPIDLHLKGLAALSADIREQGGRIYCDGSHLRGAQIHLDYPSVGATENIMMAATAAEGETRIENAAREPEIVDLQRFLRAAGFRVSGAGSSTIVVQGGCEPREVDFAVMPDRIVAGTLLVAAAVTGGEITLTKLESAHLYGTLSKLSECGMEIRAYADAVTLRATRRPKALMHVETLPHPGFPTDMQAPLFTLLSIADGTSVLVENVFENRFKHAQELSRMGAVSTIRDRTAVIRGVARLSGATVTARDLRGGAALALAGLAAEGTTTVLEAQHIDRGYESLEHMLGALGAQIHREET